MLAAYVLWFDDRDSPDLRTFYRKIAEKLGAGVVDSLQKLLTSAAGRRRVVVGRCGGCCSLLVAHLVTDTAAWAA